MVNLGDPSHYCGTIHLALLSSAGQYLEDFRLNGKWLHNFWQLIYSTMKLVGHPMTRLFDHCTDQFDVFLRFLAMTEVDFWCLHSWDKITCEMDTTLSKRDPSKIQYWYFINFWHGILVSANFSYGIAVLGIPQCPPHLSSDS